MISLLITKGDYIAISESFKEAKWLKGVVGEMCNKVCPVSVHCDSQSGMHLARNQNTFYGGSKHIDIKYNIIRDEVEHNRVGLVMIDTKENSVDLMTKLFPTNKFILCVDLVV